VTSIYTPKKIKNAHHIFKGILMFGNFKAQKAPTENNIFCPSSEKVRSCREKNQFMSAIAE